MGEVKDVKKIATLRMVGEGEGPISGEVLFPLPSLNLSREGALRMQMS